MMKPVARMNGSGASAVAGRVIWSPAKSLWNMSTLACAVVFAPLLITPGAVLLFVVATYCSLLLGHSVGMHRRFIHRSYSCKKWLERWLVFVGVLVGVAGPFGILRVHDERDWAQRQDACHDFFAHRRAPLVDLFWQLNCRFRFDRPPVFVVEREFADDPWYRFLHRAFPESARIGIEKDQVDPAAWIIETLAKLGWVWDVGRPRPAHQCEDLVDLSVAS